ncbi:hypothetical protein Ga0466249_002167 [Sporomusaceae bacterium BoRhaA]|uniref:hypothetical protein n=1 Tax=Pelorhabdus rhamnosifermentans TaxID=2772457 RepID=UPI001C05F467|nr:hypothetical protein [Pelorhabdus rhamnosifermentans]MBU2701056.1 hypothetical protein [Pelorhabdus rhamnosifermentans]
MMKRQIIDSPQRIIQLAASIIMMMEAASMMKGITMEVQLVIGYLLGSANK